MSRERFCASHVFSQALMLWFIAHYVFNLEYDAKVKEVALFIQEFIFKLPASVSGHMSRSTYCCAVRQPIVAQ